MRKKGIVVGKIIFESQESMVTILNPFKDFKEDLHRVEVRRDPLLGDTSMYNRYMKEQVKFFFKDNDPALIKELVGKTAETCLFCSDAIEKNTPMYPADLVPEGRIRIGEAVLFPNLFPIAKYHAVIILSKAHFLELSGFSAEMIRCGLEAARKFVKAVYAQDSSSLFVAVNANYLFTAGATFVHPHLQMMVSPVACSYHERLLKAGNVYYQENKSCYHADLVAEESRIGLRYVAREGGWHWLTVFSPMGVNEVIAVHEAESDFISLSEEDLGDLARGISRVLAFYEGLGHLSFNYSILSVKRPLHEKSSRCLLKMVTRQNVYPNYRNDDYFLQKLLHSEVIINLPEDLASQLKVIFNA